MVQYPDTNGKLLLCYMMMDDRLMIKMIDDRLMIMMIDDDDDDR